ALEDVTVRYADAVTGRRGRIEGARSVVVVQGEDRLTFEGGFALPELRWGGDPVLAGFLVRWRGEAQLGEGGQTGAAVRGRFECEVDGERVSLEALTQALPAAEPEAPAQPPADTDAPLVELPASVRASLRGLAASVRVAVRRIEIDASHRVDGWRTVLELGAAGDGKGAEAGIPLRWTVAGEPRSTAAGEQPGRLAVALEGDLAQAQPSFELRHDVDRLPVRVQLLRRLLPIVTRWFPFPLLEKIEFRDEEILFFSSRGRDRWRGLDPRAFRRTLRSVGEDALALPEGRFRLGLDLGRWLDPEAVDRLLAQQRSKLFAGLEPLERQRRELEQRIAGLRSRLEAIDREVQRIEEASAKLRSSIEAARGLAGLFGRGGEELDRLREKLERFERKLESERGEQGTVRRQLARLETERGRLVARIAQRRSELEQKLERMRERIAVPDDPFTFVYRRLDLRFAVHNDNPWDGSGGLAGLREAAVSRVQLAALAFTGRGRDFPSIAGWWDLEGRYALTLAPSASVLAQLEKLAPPLAARIREAGGISWGPDGFDARLVPGGR
ncbi:MAG: hypothetical protein D6776_07630, partial [Planctomycetota bacterium]